MPKASFFRSCVRTIKIVGINFVIMFVFVSARRAPKYISDHILWIIETIKPQISSSNLEPGGWRPQTKEILSMFMLSYPSHTCKAHIHTQTANPFFHSVSEYAIFKWKTLPPDVRLVLFFHSIQAGSTGSTGSSSSTGRAASSNTRLTCA